MGRYSIAIAVVLLVMPAVAFAQPAVKCFSTPVNGDTSGSLSCVQTGDWIIAVDCISISAAATPTIGCPTGFSSPAFGKSFDASQVSQQICYKIATGSDTSASTYVFTPVSGSSGFDITSLIDLRGGSTTFGAATATAGNNTHPVGGNVSAALPDAAAVVAFCLEGGATYSNISPTPGWSPIYTGSNINQEGGAMYKFFAAATTVPTATALVSSSHLWLSNSFTFGGTASSTTPTHRGFFVPIQATPTPMAMPPPGPWFFAQG